MPEHRTATVMKPNPMPVRVVKTSMKPNIQSQFQTNKMTMKSRK